MDLFFFSIFKIFKKIQLRSLKYQDAMLLDLILAGATMVLLRQFPLCINAHKCIFGILNY